jgi:hypothetical protein
MQSPVPAIAENYNLSMPGVAILATSIGKN